MRILSTQIFSSLIRYADEFLYTLVQLCSFGNDGDTSMVDFTRRIPPMPLLIPASVLFFAYYTCTYYIYPVPLSHFSQHHCILPPLAMTEEPERPLSPPETSTSVQKLQGYDFYREALGSPKNGASLTLELGEQRSRG